MRKDGGGFIRKRDGGDSVPCTPAKGIIPLEPDTKISLIFYYTIFNIIKKGRCPIF